MTVTYGKWETPYQRLETDACGEEQIRIFARISRRKSLEISMWLFFVVLL